jgi:putative transposase
MALDKDLIDKLIEGYQKPEDLIGENGLLKQLTKALIERAMKAELTHELGYEKHDPQGRGSGNSRNGTSRKKLKGDFGEVEIEVPRDREGEFEPKIVPKHQRRFAALVNKVVSAGMSGLLLETSFKHGVELMKGFLNAAIDFGPASIFK